MKKDQGYQLETNALKKIKELSNSNDFSKKIYGESMKTLNTPTPDVLIKEFQKMSEVEGQEFLEKLKKQLAPTDKLAHLRDKNGNVNYLGKRTEGEQMKVDIEKKMLDKGKEFVKERVMEMIASGELTDKDIQEIFKSSGIDKNEVKQVLENEKK